MKMCSYLRLLVKWLCNIAGSGKDGSGIRKKQQGNFSVTGHYIYDNNSAAELTNEK